MAQRYRAHFPPSCPRFKSSDGWLNRTQCLLIEPAALKFVQCQHLEAIDKKIHLYECNFPVNVSPSDSYGGSSGCVRWRFPRS